MIIIKGQGGIGNQLFQYALYRKYLFLGRDVCLDTSIYKTKYEKREWYLDYIASDINYCSLREKRKISDDYYSFVGLTKRKIFGKKDTHYYEKDSSKYKDEILKKDNAYLDGYWQNEKYFCDIRSDLLNSINFPESYGEYQKFEKMIKMSESVSLHIRRGDYLQHTEKYRNLAETNYYDFAFEYILKNVNNPVFFVFSDDLEWCRKRYGNENLKMVFIDNVGHYPFDDLYLMSVCKHNIIANSSFSWWGAYFNQKSKKYIVLPDEWRGRSDSIPGIKIYF